MQICSIHNEYAKFGYINQPNLLLYKRRIPGKLLLKYQIG